MKLTPAQIATVARKAGVPAGQIPTAVAIALAESGDDSGGETTAHNSRPPDDSYGLWQINMYGPLGPDRRAKLNMERNTQLFEPNANARAMMLISNNGTNWRPWSTYTSGAYLKHMGTAVAATGQGDVPVTGDPTGGADIGSAGAQGAHTEGIMDFTTLLSTPDTWWRVGYILGGGVMLFIGFMTILSHSKTGRTVITHVKKVVP